MFNRLIYGKRNKNKYTEENKHEKKHNNFLQNKINQEIKKNTH